MSRSPGRLRKRKRVEADVFDDLDEGWPEQEFDDVRNPELGPWQETIKARITVGVMFSVPLLALLAIWIGWNARSNANSAVASVEELSQRPTPEWQPFFSTVADAAAERLAHELDMTVVSRIDSLYQAETFGLAADQFVGVPPDPASYVPRRSWIEGFGTERHAYLLRQQDHYEALSFFVGNSSGQAAWPTLSPYGDGELDASGFGRLLDESTAAAAEDAQSLGIYELMRSSLGVAEDEVLPTMCGVAAPPDSPLPLGLSVRIEEFVRAFTARDAEQVREIANSGADWPLYARPGWRYRDGSMRVLCFQFDETTNAGLAQVWWVVESSADPQQIIPEVRDVIVVDNLGLWQVSGAGKFMSGGFVPAIP